MIYQRSVLLLICKECKKKKNDSIDAVTLFSTVQTDQLNKVRNGQQSKPTSAKSSTSPELSPKNESSNDEPQQQNGGSEVLPNMRIERAQSVAKRRQRPVTSPAGAKVFFSQQLTRLLLYCKQPFASLLIQRTDDTTETTSMTRLLFPEVY